MKLTGAPGWLKKTKESLHWSPTPREVATKHKACTRFRWHCGVRTWGVLKPIGNAFEMMSPKLVATGPEKSVPKKEMLLVHIYETPLMEG